MINLELPKKLTDTQDMAYAVAKDMFRPIARKYDTIEHTDGDIPELKVLGEMMESMGGGKKSSKSEKPADEVVNGEGMATVLGAQAMSYGCLGLMMSVPGFGLGNAAITAVATKEQKEKLGKVYAAMAITEPGTGSDSAGVRTTAVLDGDEWVINGEKIFVTDGDRCSHVVVWATLDRSMGKAAIKSFVVPKGTPGMEVARLEHKMGIRCSDTAAINFTDCRIPKDFILGSPDIAKTAEERKKAFGGVMQTFDSTRPLVASFALGVAEAALEIAKEILEKEGVKPSYDKTLYNSTSLEAEIYKMEADLESARLLTLKACWMADNGQTNSTEASISKAKAGRMGNYVTLKCVEICSSLGYSETSLLEKFARDSKIIDIYEGTQQIQQLIVARNILGLSSGQLK